MSDAISRKWYLLRYSAFGTKKKVEKNTKKIIDRLVLYGQNIVGPYII